MSSGGSRTFVGGFRGTGAIINIDTLSFKPRRVELINIDSEDSLRWQQGMVDDSGYKSIAAGTNSFVTSDGVTPRPQGFAIGAETDINVSGEEVLFTAWE